jgi:hypothetical protein
MRTGNVDQDQTMTSNNDTVDEQKPETMDVEAAIDDFGEVEMLEGQLRVECSCSFFATAGKGEDRFTVVVGGDQLGTFDLFGMSWELPDYER